MRGSTGFNGPASTGMFSLSRSLSLFPKTQSREGTSQGVKKSTTKKIKDINCISVPTDVPKTNCKVAKMADSISSNNVASINDPNVFEQTNKVSQTGRVKNTPKMFNKMQVKDDNGPAFKNAGKILKDEAKYNITYERAEDAGAIKGFKALPSRSRQSSGGGRPSHSASASNYDDYEEADEASEQAHAADEAADSDLLPGIPKSPKGKERYTDSARESSYGEGAPANVPHREARVYVNKKYGTWNDYGREVTALALHHGFDESAIVRKAKSNNIQKMESFLKKAKIPLPKSFKPKN